MEKTDIDIDKAEVLNIRLSNTVKTVNKAFKQSKKAIKELRIVQEAIEEFTSTGSNFLDVEKFYTMSEVSKMCGLSKHVLRQDVKKGILKPSVKGHRSFFKKDQVEQYLKQD
mgnify:FL=1